MGAIRRRELLGPPSLVLSSALLITAIVPAAIAAGSLRPPPSPAAPCPTEGPLREGGLAAVEEVPDGTRLSLEAVVTSSGEETGQRLVVESESQPSLLVALPPESFMAPPVRELVVYGSHNPAAGSEVRVVAVSSGCDVRLARPNHVVRSAVLDGDGRALYVHAVTEAERLDVGVLRHDLETGEVTRVVEHLPESDYFGPTFATLLRWSTAGDELAVQSCGFDHCRTRVLDATTGAVQTYAGNGHGALVGFDRRSLYVFDACHGAPCDLLAIDRVSGDAVLLVGDAFEASVESRPEATAILVETAAGMLEVAR